MWTRINKNAKVREFQDAKKCAHTPFKSCKEVARVS